MPSPRQMTMIAFMQAQNCSNYVGSWRHPASHSDFLRPEYFQRIARILEDGKFHMAFFDDRLAMPDRYKNDHVESVEGGVRVVKLDVITIMTVMGLASSLVMGYLSKKVAGGMNLGGLTSMLTKEAHSRPADGAAVARELAQVAQSNPMPARVSVRPIALTVDEQDRRAG